MKQLLLIFLLIPLFGLSNQIESTHFKDPFPFNRRVKYPVGFNVVVLGPAGIVGGSFDWFVTPKVNFEIGAGLNDIEIYKPAYFAGTKFHFLGKTLTNTTFYLGLFDKVTVDSSNVNQVLYVPFGVQRIKRNKVTWNIEVAYTYGLIDKASNFYGSFKLGYRFNRFDKKKK